MVKAIDRILLASKNLSLRINYSPTKWLYTKLSWYFNKIFKTHLLQSRRPERLIEGSQWRHRESLRAKKNLKINQSSF